MASQRHLSRIVAMQTFFSHLHRPETDVVFLMESCAEELDETLRNFDFSSELLNGAIENKNATQDLVKKYSHDKNMDKIDPLTFSILAIAIYELVFSPAKQAHAIIINEAIELAKEFGKENSPALINALLSKISSE